jgi:hypothetical protein
MATNNDVRNAYDLLMDLASEAKKSIPLDEPITLKQLNFLKSLAARNDVPAQQKRFLINYLTRPNKTRLGARKIIWITKQKMMNAVQ